MWRGTCAQIKYIISWYVVHMLIANNSQITWYIHNDGTYMHVCSCSYQQFYFYSQLYERSPTWLMMVHSYQWRIQDFYKRGGCSTLLHAKRASFEKPRPPWGIITPIFDRWDKLPPLPVQSIRFRTNFLLKQSKVSHSRSYLSSIPRKGCSI